MISEPVMHDCIYKLLRSEIQDSLEDQLECLCKLLTTIGKDLDHVKAKVTTRKTSSFRSVLNVCINGAIINY